jgi:hypothetical protein
MGDVAIQNRNEGFGATVLTLKPALKLCGVFVESVLSSRIKVGRGCQVR